MLNYIITSDQHSTLAPSLASQLDKEHLIIHVGQFPSSETKVTSFEDKRLTGKHILHVHQFSSGSQAINQSLFDLLLILESLKVIGVSNIRLLMPYMPYARQNTTMPLIINMLYQAGVKIIITYDIHNPSLINQEPSGIKNISTTDYWVDLIKNIPPDLKNICIATPDYGAMARTMPIAQKLGVPLVCLTKKRIENNQVIITAIDSNVAGKKIIMIDDILDTGNTAIAACNALLEQDALSVSGLFSHAVLSEGAVKKLQESRFEKIFVGNSLLGLEELGDKFVIVDLYGHLSEEVL